MLAFVLERRASKQEILELYLNEIYLGQAGSFSINGMGEAARMYFHKDVANLTLPEAALLAGMIQSPNPYNPYRHTERATERRNMVLRAMREAGFIEEATAEAAMAQPLRGRAPALDSAEAPYFVDLVGNAARAALRGEGPHRPRTSRSTPRSTCTCRPLPRTALANGLEQPSTS